MLFYLGFVLSILLGGCAAVPMELAMEGADAGVSFTSADARSFTYSKVDVHAAAVAAMNHMQIKMVKDVGKGDNIKMEAKTKNLTIYMTLTFITPTVTKVAVKAKKNWFSKDTTVSSEILSQINLVLRRKESPNV